MADFEGLSAIVTGGASGIGLATARLLGREGAAVAVLDTAAPPEDLMGIYCDVASRQSVDQAVDAAAKALGGLDIVVSNVGVGAQGGPGTNEDDEWSRVLDINVTGMMRVTRAALAHLRKSAHGTIVLTASIASTVGLPQRVLYSASKGAVLSMMRAMAADLIVEGIRVNAVAPGTADTPWVQRLLSRTDDPLAELKALRARQPHGRLVTADEVAQAIAFLADPRNESTVGVCLAVDGGMDALRLKQS